MADWSTKRRRNIFLIIFAFLIVLVALPSYLLFYKAPTCEDGKQNGEEAGVDCGGSCRLICPIESLPLTMLGDPRVIIITNSISSGTYELVAIFNNPNPSAEARQAKYAFKVYTEGSTVPAKTVEGSTFIPKNARFAVFEGPLPMEGVVPVRATFNWLEESIVWQKNLDRIPKLEVRDEALQSGSVPRLEATVRNDNPESVNNIEAIAVIKDGSQTIFAASRTYIDKLGPGEETPIVFTWPRAFEREASSFEIFTRIFPDRSFIK